MSDDATNTGIPSLDEIAKAMDTPVHSARTMQMVMEEMRRLRARVVELEAQAATMFGTLERPAEDEPATYTHNVPPSAPR